MVYLTKGMEPRRVLQYFEDICGIPHGSGHEGALAEYIMDIALKKGLETKQDQHGNVLVRLTASKGSEKAPCFLMQGHMDMVCQQEEGYDFDMLTQPIRLRRDGNILYAEGTTLGADNGVGLCNMLAVMTDDSLRHPPMEFLFTVREETGLEGIRLFDCCQLLSRRMLTMDCGDPGVLILGSAGSLCYELEMGLGQEGFRGNGWVLQVCGLHGGHTGLEVGNGYANALTMVIDIAAELERHFGARLCSVEVGGGSSSIPNAAVVKMAIPLDQEKEAANAVQKRIEDYHSEFAAVEPGMTWTFAPDEGTEKMLTGEASQTLLDFLMFSPCGALKRHREDPKQVMGSALLKCVGLKDGLFTARYAIRSNTDAYKYQLGRRFTRLCGKYRVTYRIVDDSPAWPEKQHSRLTEICVKVHETCFGTQPARELVHGGEEASIVAYHIPEMEIVGHAPYSRGAHTTKERLHLDTMPIFWKFLTELLTEMSQEK